VLNGECEVGWFGLLHAILFTIFVTSLVRYTMEVICSSSGLDSVLALCVKFRARVLERTARVELLPGLIGRRLLVNISHKYAVVT